MIGFKCEQNSTGHYRLCDARDQSIKVTPWMNYYQSCVQHVLKSAFDKGKQAFHDGLYLEDNPYHPKSLASDEWFRGYLIEDMQASGDYGEIFR